MKSRVGGRNAAAMVAKVILCFLPEISIEEISRRKKLYIALVKTSNDFLEPRFWNSI